MFLAVVVVILYDLCHVLLLGVDCVYFILLGHELFKHDFDFCVFDLMLITYECFYHTHRSSRVDCVFVSLYCWLGVHCIVGFSHVG